MIYKNFTPFPVLTTNRLKLRALSMDDAETIFALRSDPEINKYLNREISTSVEDARNFIRKISEGVATDTFIYWAITLTENNEFVGTIGLFSFSDTNQQCEIGYELLPRYQRQGIMKEAAIAVIGYAFQTLGIQKIEAFTHKDNNSSTKLLEAIHFKRAITPPEENPNLIVFTLSNSHQ